jgi:hypothetical protein
LHKICGESATYRAISVNDKSARATAIRAATRKGAVVRNSCDREPALARDSFGRNS